MINPNEPTPEERAEAERRATEATAASYAHAVSPLFINGFVLVGDNDMVRVIVGDRLAPDFMPRGHIIMSLSTVAALHQALGEMLSQSEALRAEARGKAN